MYPWYSLHIVLSLLCLVAPVMSQAQELPTADRLGIQTVIEQQLKAFRQDDAAGAFAFASPSIQAKFGTPAVFLRMVQTAYQPVYRSRHVTFKALQLTDGVPTQAVFLVGPDGVPVMAFYLMQKQPDGAWKIDGCYLTAFKDERL